MRSMQIDRIYEVHFQNNYSGKVRTDKFEEFSLIIFRNALTNNEYIKAIYRIETTKLLLNNDGSIA